MSGHVLGGVTLGLIMCDKHLGLLTSCSLLGIKGDYNREHYDKLNEGHTYESKYPTPPE
jgi:hypothetical protein